MPSTLVPTLMLCGLALCRPAQGAVSLMVDKATQQARDVDRRFILRTELQDEQAALASAEQGFKAHPGAEQAAALHRHIENVKALQRELGLAVRVTAAPPAGPARVAAVRATPATAASWDVYERAGSDSLDVYDRPPTPDLSTPPERKETP